MTKKKLSVGSSEILEILKEQKEPLTFAQIKAIYPNANPSHLGALIRGGLAKGDKAMVKEIIEREVEKTVYQALPETESE